MHDRSPVKLWAVAISIALVFAMGAYAQFQTGNIYGKVQAKDGSALPGVTVTLTGMGAPQTTVTGPLGDFRFISLSPGTYSLKAELAGYGIAARTGVGVRVAQNADVTMTLNPSVAESITVTAEAPLLDVRKAGSGIDVSKVELQNIPTGRDPWVIMGQTPGVLLDRNNVGGSESGQQSIYVSKGQTADQSSWNVDGVNITDVGSLGSSPTYYDFDSFEEMQITTGGSDPRIKTPGVQMNFVTKRGTNDFKGSGRWFQTNQAWQSNPTIPVEAQSYLQRVNQIDKIEDRGIEIGGPILKDKLWIWGAFSRNNVNLLTATLLSSGNRFLDKTLLSNENVKLNAQLLPSNSLAITDMYGNKVKIGRNVGPTRAPETSWNQANQYKNGSTGNLGNPTMWKIEDTQIFGSSLYLTGLYSQVQGGFKLIADNGQGCRTYDCGINGGVAYLDTAGDGAWHRSYFSEAITRPQSQGRIDGSKFFDIGTMNHELKFGFGYRNAPVHTQFDWGGDQYTSTGPVGPAGDTGFVQFTRPEDIRYKVNYKDAYLGDTVLLGNLTIQAALRYDLQKGDNPGGVTVANRTLPDLLPAVNYSAVSGLKWTNVSPRIGLTYALGANKRTLLRASYNRYVDQLGGNWVYNASPGGVYSYLYYYYKDLNGDHVAQRNEIDFNYGLVASGGIDPNNPSSLIPTYRWASNFKAPNTDELILGVEQELLSDFSVGATGTYRKMKDFVWFVGEHTRGAGDLYNSSDFVLHDPVTATLPNGSTVSLPYYVLKPGDAPPAYYVIGNRPDYSQQYKSLDLYATKRLSNRWMFRGNVTLQDWTQQVGAGAIVDPSIARSSTLASTAGSATGNCTVCNGSQVIVGSGTGSGSKGGIYINSKWAYNLTGTYQIPVIETAFGVNLTGRQGYPIPYAYRITGPGGNDAQGDTIKYLLAENTVDTFRQPALTELDLRLAKEIRIWRGGVTFSVDAFNVLNKQTILQRDVRRLNGLASSDHITELQSPRVLRLGARVSF